MPALRLGLTSGYSRGTMMIDRDLILEAERTGYSRTRCRKRPHAGHGGQRQRTRDVPGIREDENRALVVEPARQLSFL